MPSPRPPSLNGLREYALFYLNRFPATRASVRRVLQRKVSRWARAASADPESLLAIEERLASSKIWIETILDDLCATQIINDTLFAKHRAQSLGRSGRSQQSMRAYLMHRGVDAATIHQTLLETNDISSALALCRRRRIGPFSSTPADQALRLRWMGILGRAGFDHQTARQVLEIHRADADDRICALRNS